MQYWFVRSIASSSLCLISLTVALVPPRASARLRIITRLGNQTKDRFGEAPKPTREARVLSGEKTAA
jgi:hypothetical protein